MAIYSINRDRHVKWSASFRWSFGPDSAWGSKVSTTILTTHPSLFISFKQTLVKIFRIRSKRNWWMWKRINGRLFWNVLKKVSGKIIKPNLERHVSALVQFSNTPYGGFPLRSSFTRYWGHHHTTPACVPCMIPLFEEHLKFMKLSQLRRITQTIPLLASNELKIIGHYFKPCSKNTINKFKGVTTDFDVSLS